MDSEQTSVRTSRPASGGRRLVFLLPALAFTALLTVAASAPGTAPGRAPETGPMHAARAALPALAHRAAHPAFHRVMDRAVRALDAAAHGDRTPADASAARDGRAMAAVLTATKTDNRAAGDAVAGGGTVNYTVTLANTGDADALGVLFSDTVDPNTTLAGAVRVSPLGFPDGYGFLTGETLAVMPGTGLLANDYLGQPAAPVTAFSLDGFATSHAAGATAPVPPDGSLTVNADGSLTFEPPTGFAGSLVFDYRLANVAGDDEAEVTLTQTPPVPPTAADDGPAATSAPGDAYHTAFETPFALAAPGVLANDDRGTPTAALTSFGGGSLGGAVTDHAAGSAVPLGGGGSLQVDADGAVAFTPPAGFAGPFTFQYRLTSSSGTSDATVTIAVGARPAAADDVYPYVLVGNVPVNTASSTGFTVLANDAGDGATLAVTSMSNGTVVLDANTGTFAFEPAPGYEGPAGFTYDLTSGFGTVSASVSLSVAGMLWFLDNAAGPGVGTLTSPFNSVAAFTAVNDGVGDHPAPGDHVFLYERAAPYDGPLTLLDGQVVVGQDATASLAAIAGVMPPPDSPPLPATDAGNATTATLGGASGGVVLAQNNALYGLTVAPTAGTGIAGAGFGTLTVDDVTVDAGETALDLSAGTLDAAFDGVSSGGGARNVALTGVGGAADLGGGALAGSTAEAFLVAGGNATLAYAGSITNATDRAVSISGRTGGTLTLSGAIVSTGTGLLVQNNAGGTVAFTGSPISVTTTGLDQGVTLANNAGATVAFSGGGLAIVTDDGNGFDATGGGTVVVSGAGNTVASTGGAALSVVNTTIGAGGLTFRSLSADGGANGVVLSTTGVAGGLTVTGAGTAGSGGTIQNIAGADGAAGGNGVYLADTRDASLSWMDVTGTDNNGVLAAGVRGLAMDRLRFTGTHGTSAGAAFEESAVHLVDVGGAVAVTNSRLDGGAYHALLVRNTAGTAPTLDSLVVAGDTVGTMQGSLVDVRSTALRVLIGDGTADVRLRGNHVAYWWANAIHVTAQGTGAVTARITGNEAHQTSGALAGAGGIWVNGGDLAFDISGNSVRGANGIAISADRLPGGGPDMEGTIADNAVGQSGVPNSGSGTGIGIFAGHTGPGTTTLRIAANTVRQINGSASGAITVQAGDDVGGGGAGTMNATVEGNDIQESGTIVNSAQHGILVTHGRATGDADVGCYDILDNVIVNFNSGSAPTAQNRIRVNLRFVTTARFPGYTGLNNDNTAFRNYMLGRNPGTNHAHANNVGAGGSGYTNTVPPGSPCPQPAPLRVAAAEAAPAAPAATSPAPDLLGSADAMIAPLDRLVGGEPTPALFEGVAAVPGAVLLASADPREAARIAVEATPAARPLPADVEVAIGTLPAGKSVTILFDVTVGSPVPPATTHLSNQGTATADGGLSVVTDDPDTGTAGDPTLTLVSHDTAGPVTSNVVMTPNPAAVNTAVVLTATVSDATSGGSPIASAAYSLDGGAYQAMAAADAAFDEVTEDVTAALGTFAQAGVHTVCVRGTDAAANTGVPACVLLAVYDPDEGHVTGAGWFNSPAGAYVAAPGFTGKTHLTFQARYANNATVPTGRVRFWLQGQSFTFESTAYAWLVIAGDRAQIRGTGTLNGGGSYGFMLTAIDGSPDRFRIRIWNEDAGDALVYDNQVGLDCTDTSDTAVPCTVHSHGSIHIHTQNNAHGPTTPPEPAPEAFSLQVPRPNPSAGRAALRFGLPEAAEVELVVFDALGREVARLADGALEAGWHVVMLDGLHLPSGAYFARMTAGEFLQTQRLLIVR